MVALTKALAGTMLAERYRVEREVGSGGFGVVFAGAHLFLDVPIAIKVVHADRLTDVQRARAFDRFLAEARTVAQLRHDNIVRILDMGVRPADDELPELPWLVMEWCEGETLAELLAARRGSGGQSRAAAWRLMAPILDALAYAHERGIVHRDLKPANIIVDKSGAPRVLDFGIAKMVHEDERAAEDTATQSDQRAFTLGYAAPEQVSGKRTGSWTDVHALGIILTELLTDEPPFNSVDSAELMRDVLSETRPTPAKRAVDAGPWEPVIARAVAFAVADRHADAGALRAALAAHAPALDTRVSDGPPAEEEVSRTRTSTEVIVQRTDEPMALASAARSRSSLVWPAVGVLSLLGVAGVVVSSMQGGARETTSASPAVSDAPSAVPSAVPAGPTAHPRDGYDAALLLKRIRDAGWTVTQHPGMTAPGHSSQRFQLTRPEQKGLVVLYDWDSSETAINVQEGFDRFPKSASQRRGSMALFVDIETDAAEAKALLARIAATDPLPMTGGAAVPIDGTGWERFDVPTELHLQDVWGVDNDEVFAVGNHGVVLRFDGSRWHREASGTTDDLYGVWGRDTRRFAVGTAGRIIRREGDAWSVEESGTIEPLYAIGGTPTRTVAAGRVTVVEREAARWRVSSSDLTFNFAAIIDGSGFVGLVTERGRVYASSSLGEVTDHASWPTDEHALPWLLVPARYDLIPEYSGREHWPLEWKTGNWTPRAYLRVEHGIVVAGTAGTIYHHDFNWHATKLDTQDLQAMCRTADGAIFVVGARGSVFRKPP